MIKYAALLRGIGPGAPNMRNEKLRGVFEGLGYSNVASVISSGNIVFESDRTDVRQMEAELEAAWPAKLGFTSTTIIRSQDRLNKLVKSGPFKALEHGPRSYLLATFFKRPTKVDFELPYQVPGKPSRLLGVIDNTLFSSTDTTSASTIDLMTWLEKQFGKEISSRTWLSVNRILKKMG